MPTLTSLLARDAIVSLDVVEQALQRQVLEGGEIDTALLELAAVPENVLAAYRAASFDLPPAARAQLERIDPKLIARVPAKLAREFRVLPIALERDLLVLSVDAPLQALESQRLSTALGARVTFRIATELRICAALHQHYGVELPERLGSLEQRLRVVSPGELCEVRQSTPSREPIAFRSRVSARPPDAGLRVPFEGGIAEAVRRVSNSLPPPAPSPSSTSSAAVARVLAADNDSVQRPSPPKPVVAAVPVSSGGSSGGQAHPRRLPRGPFTWQQAVEFLGEATDRDRILEIFFNFARQYFECSVLFVMREDRLYPFRSAGLSASADEEGISLRMLSGGAVFAATQTLSARVADLRGHSSDAALLGAIGRARFQPCALVPIAIRKRIIGLLYGDRAGEALDLIDFSEVLPLVANVGVAFERVIQERKRNAAEGQVEANVVRPLGAQLTLPPGPPRTESSMDTQSRRAAGPAPAEPQFTLPPKPHTSDDRRGFQPAPGSGEHASLHASRVATSPEFEVSPQAPSVATSPALEASAQPAPATPASAQVLATAQPVGAVASSAESNANVANVAARAPAERRPAAPVAAAAAPSGSGSDMALQPTMQMPAEPIERARRASQRPPPGAGSYSERGGEERVRAERRDEAKTSPERPGRAMEAKRPSSIARISLGPPPRTLSQVPAGSGSYSMRPGGATQRERVYSDVDLDLDPTDPPPPMPPPATRAAGAAPAPLYAAPTRNAPAAEPRSASTLRSASPSAVPVATPARAEAAAAGRAPAKELPSIVVAQPSAEAERLADELSRSGPEQGQELISALVRLGGDGLGALQRRFPGPLWFDRSKPRHRMPSGHDISAIARGVRAFDEHAVPVVADLMSSPQVDARLCAMLMAAERPRSALIWPLYQRLFDADGQVRLVALEALPRFRGLPEFAEVLRLLRERSADEREPIASRLSALEAIGALRDAGSVELLLKLCHHGSRQLSVPAHRGLLAITAQDFGDSDRKWKGWLEKNRQRPRVEWLIDSLMHADERVRNTAGLELQKLTQVYYGFVASSSKRDRERAQQRYRDWLRQQDKTPTLG